VQPRPADLFETDQGGAGEVIRPAGNVNRPTAIRLKTASKRLFTKLRFVIVLNSLFIGKLPSNARHPTRSQKLAQFS
jgi:hypothetical protein